MSKIMLAILSIILSGLAFYFGGNFHNQGWLIWIAPIPVILYSYYAGWISTFLVAFLARIGFGLNDLIGYYPTPIPSTTFILPIVQQSLIWAVIVVLSQYFIKNIRIIGSLFIYPSLIALAEWLISFTNGTDGTIAYSQLHYLSLIQIVSVTGFIGISFVLSLFSSSFADAIFFYFQKIKNYKRVFISFGIAFVTLLSTFSYGKYRLNEFMKMQPEFTAKMGLIALNYSPDRIFSSQYAAQIVESYTKYIDQLINSGAQYIVLPEESFFVTDENRNQIQSKFISLTKQKTPLTIIIGIREKEEDNLYNKVWLFKNGEFIGTYYKRHLVPETEYNLSIKNTALLNFTMENQNAGIAICRDMDYITPAQSYGMLGTQILFVPSWDFVVDANSHFSGARLRSIENGYTLVRASREGLLTISTPTGEIIAKADATTKNPAFIFANVPIYKSHLSFYSLHPYWFIKLIFVLLILCVLQIFWKRSKKESIR